MDLSKVFATHLDSITKTGNKIIQMVGVQEAQTAVNVHLTIAILLKVKHLVE